MCKVLRRATCAAAACLMISFAAHAQMLQTVSPAPGPPGSDMTMQEYQSLSCAIGGVAGGIAVYVYYEDIGAALTGAVAPVLLLPFIAAGFSTACGMASALAPVTAWAYRHTFGSPHSRSNTQ
jgi:hypothetical protein